MNRLESIASPPLPLANFSDRTPRSNAAHTILFWVLTTLALALFAPCVLVPIVYEVEEAREYEARMKGVVLELESRVAQNEARRQALNADPLVNERIVRRELNYQPQGEQLIRLPADEAAGLRVHFPELGSVAADAKDEPPVWARSLGKWLPAWPWRDLFAKSPNRQVLLGMSAALLASAFLLYGRTPTRQTCA